MDRQKEIRFLLHSNGIRLGWLSHKLGIKTSTLAYLLNESPQIDSDIYEQIIGLIKDYQYELELISKDGTEEPELFDYEKANIGIGERLRIFAKRKFGTLKKLASSMNMTPQQLQQYISGKREPGSKVLIRLLRLGCDINWLLGGTESLESYKIHKLEIENKKLRSGYLKMGELIKSQEI